ncbi:MAG: glycine cleavage system protein GcvH [Armatimonadetes bacterium]|nr:glycine cleavage system protein GcvH [Armatimonadota bacterium]
MSVPENLKYTKTHEWVKVDGDVATVGITDHAQSELGDIVYLDLPQVGRALQREENLGSVESVKTVSDLYSPVSGEVVETNGVLTGQSELVNTDPYLSGWILKIKLSNPAELDDLMDSDTYKSTL